MGLMGNTSFSMKRRHKSSSMKRRDKKINKSNIHDASKINLETLIDPTNDLEKVIDQTNNLAEEDKRSCLYKICKLLDMFKSEMRDIMKNFRTYD